MNIKKVNIEDLPNFNYKTFLYSIIILEKIIYNPCYIPILYIYRDNTNLFFGGLPISKFIKPSRRSILDDYIYYKQCFTWGIDENGFEIPEEVGIEIFKEFFRGNGGFE